MAPWVVLGWLLTVPFTTLSCSETPAERAAKQEARGDAYLQQDRLREALISYKNAARATPDKTALQWKLAQAALKTGEASTAYHALRRIVQLDPSHFDANWSLGDLYVAAGKSQEADMIADAMIAARPEHPAGYLVQAGVALVKDQLTDAIRLLKQAVQLDPTMLRPLLVLANIYFSQHEVKRAAEWYERAVKAHPDSTEAHVAFGRFLFATGSPIEGRQQFRRAVELTPDREHIGLLLADQYRALGRREEAEHELIGLVSDMNSHRARKALAELKLTLGQIAEAKLLVNAILERDNRDPVGLYLKGRLALADKDHVQAASLFEEAIAKNVTLAAPHLYLGLVRWSQGRVEAAQEELREAIRLEPNHEGAHLSLAKLYLMQQKSAEAEKEARQALRLNPSDPEAAVLTGDALVLGKSWTKAEEVYGTIIRQLPDHPLGYVKMAALRKLQGRFESAAQLFSQALSHAPNDLQVLQDYLFTLLQTKQPQQADHVLGQYLNEESRDFNLWRLAGRVYLAQQRTDQAERAFRKAVDLVPDLAQVHYELGQVYFSERKFSAAESAFRMALKKEDTNSAVHTALGLLLAVGGQTDEANEHYRRAVQLDATNAVAANNLASNLTERRDLDDALGLALSALHEAPTNPAIKDTLGWIYYKKQRFLDAQRLLGEASAALPQHPTVRYHHAMTLAKLGKEDEALAELKTALALPGRFPEAGRAAQMVASNKIDD
jgi:Tfp pilus assembly protein PilF